MELVAFIERVDTLKVEAAGSSKTLITFHQTSQHHHLQEYV
jgi:hypothetical protein